MTREAEEVVEGAAVGLMGSIIGGEDSVAREEGAITDQPVGSFKLRKRNIRHETRSLSNGSMNSMNVASTNQEPVWSRLWSSVEQESKSTKYTCSWGICYFTISSFSCSTIRQHTIKNH